MKLSDFLYDLPPELIAQSPLENRDNSRLLMLENEKLNEDIFSNIINYLSPNDVLVLNKTKVIKARLFWELDIFPKWIKKVKKIEILLHKQISSDTWECLWYPWKNLKVWRNIRFFNKENNIILNWKIEKVSEMWRYISFDKSDLDFYKTIEILWELPLPPYITEKLKDDKRYQTVFNEIPWSIAAPTAWLHFTENLINDLQKKWVIIEKILLHVWIGTFKPVEVENILEHHMHSEFIEIEKEVSDRLNNYKKQWKNIIAVWTTSVRTLESFALENWELWYWNKDTSIFIYPSYKWKFVDSLITNFHLPWSTLLMLVSSLAWYDEVKKAYEYAIKNKFRFFSFWDAMRIKSKK